VTLRQGRYGNATLSRHPIILSENIDLTLGNKKRRGCQHAIVEIESSRGYKYLLNTFNLHLGLSPQERAEQIGILAQSTPFKERDPNLPCLVVGDFNDWRNLLSPVFTGVMDFKCATNHKQGNQYPFKTYPSLSPTGGLDKIFFDGSLRLTHAFTCRLNLSKIASDHVPIIADFELTQ
jgi:endonuclease/exonuclease/phosphatase family metal-dependent hydrolase